MAANLLLPPSGGATIRMYRSGGLGDCFLLALAGSGDTPCYILIDCGVFLGTANASHRMQQIATDIEATTGGRLDVLVVTHEHWDHLAGFSFARDVFQRLRIGEVWLAWTEDLQNPLARQMRHNRQRALTALWAVSARMQSIKDPRSTELNELLSFHGEQVFGATARSSEQIQFVKSLGTVRYCRPGQPPLALPNAPSVRAYVLGPPENEVLLKQSHPRRGQVYESSILSPSTNLEGSLLAGGFFTAAMGEATRVPPPFDQRFVLPLEDLARSDNQTEYSRFFQEYYGFRNMPGGPEWRRIDNEWLGEAERLALDLDNDTNNTSLVLAFELPKGKVLLFPGDAQAGNWLSWADVRWQDGTTSVSGLDLLRRVAVYKVGHHGSHNATLSAQGLELMEREDLIALLPVDEVQARRKRWAMPFAPLYERLLIKTKGRLLRADTGIPPCPENISSDQWNTFLDLVREDSSSAHLWIELSILDH